MKLPPEIERRIEEIGKRDHGLWPEECDQNAESGAREMAEHLMELVCDICGGPAEHRVCRTGDVNLMTWDPITRAQFLSHHQPPPPSDEGRK